jgi:SAM-dependent methyltransferase
VSDRRTRIVEAGYDALGDRFGEWAARVADPARERYLEAFSQRLDADASVLELGCGAAPGTTRALASRFRLMAVDLSQRQLDAAREQVPGATLLRGDFLELELPAASFEGVAAFYSLNHVPRERLGELLERIAGWLVPGGVLVAVLGAGNSPDWVGEWIDGTTMFFSSWDAETNRRLLARAGFALVLDELVTIQEPEGSAIFHWVLATR